MAILSDALHDLGDSLSLGLAWYFQRLSGKGPDRTFTFGYKRFNTLGALINGVVLVAGSIIILTEAIPRLFNPTEPMVEGMIVLAVLGVIVNGWAALRLRRGGNSLNEQVLTWHLLEDVLGWVAVLIGSGLMYFYDLPWIDAALSIGITLLVLFNVIRRLWDAGKVILQAAPEGIDPEQVKRRLESIAHVRDIHHTHLWTLDGDYNLITIHVRTDGSRPLRELQPIKAAIREELRQMDIEHVTIEFEAEGEDCADDEL